VTIYSWKTAGHLWRNRGESVRLKKNPHWCGLYEAWQFMGCWSLHGGTQKSHSDCNGCEYQRHRNKSERYVNKQMVKREMERMLAE